MICTESADKKQTRNMANCKPDSFFHLINSAIRQRAVSAATMAIYAQDQRPVQQGILAQQNIRIVPTVSGKQ